MLLSAGLAVVAVGAAAHGAFHRNSPVFGSAMGRLPRSADRTPRVSLTFDDGPNPVATPRILDALGEAGVRATFFVLGRHAERWPDLVARAAREGHQIANHGYHHRKLHDRGPTFVRRDIAMGSGAIQDAGGGTPRLFRAPHGFRSPWVTAIAASLGERTVGWSLGVWDTALPGAAEIARRVGEGARPRSIILLHDGDGYDPAGDRRQTADAIPEIVRRLADRGFAFDTLPEKS